MEFIETPIFTKAILELLTDEEYRALQLALLFRPENGALIKGSGGLRKLRWKRKGSGKRGGITMPSRRLVPLLFGLLCLAFAFQGCSSGGSTSSGGDPGGNDPFEGYLILASFQAALMEGGSFTATVLRIDPSDPSAKDCEFTVNQTEIPLVTLASTDDEAFFTKVNWGYDPGTLYTAEVSVDGRSATCSFTAPDYTWVTITSRSSACGSCRLSNALMRCSNTLTLNGFVT